MDGIQESGVHVLQFDAGRLATGIYFYRVLTSDGHIDTKKMTMIR
jgi:hypothetical protein